MLGPHVSPGYRNAEHNRRVFVDGGLNSGELPVCYVALRPGAKVTEDELREHAEKTIAERPAWLRRIPQVQQALSAFLFDVEVSMQ